MRKTKYLILAPLVFLLSTVGTAAAATCNSDAGGDWHSISWSCGQTPVAGDDVIIDEAVSFSADIATIQDLTIESGGTLTQDNNNSQTIAGDLTVESGGTLTHSANSTEASNDPTYYINFTAKNIYINLGGTVSADGRGNTHNNGTGAGQSVSTWYGGGGHGGQGGDSSTSGEGEDGGAAYCDASTGVDTIGSGGAGTTAQSHGGGLIVLYANSTLDISGTITANAKDPLTNFGGGGAGGGIELYGDTVTLGTSGVIRAVGAENGGTNINGSGGGGCVAVLHGTSSEVGLDDINVSGGPNNSTLSPASDLGDAGSEHVGQMSLPGGGAVPEFSTYVLLFTALIGFGLISNRNSSLSADKA